MLEYTRGVICLGESTLGGSSRPVASWLLHTTTDECATTSDPARRIRPNRMPLRMIQSNTCVAACYARPDEIVVTGDQLHQSRPRM